MCARSFARANDAKIVRSRDAQRNTKESPQMRVHFNFELRALVTFLTVLTERMKFPELCLFSKYNLYLC